MFKVRSPLSRDVAAWAVARGFGLWDWSVLPIVADAVQDALGDEAREQLLEHGRWLVLAQMQAPRRPLGAATFDEKARAILEALQTRTERAKDLFRGVRGETHPELILLRSLL